MKIFIGMRNVAKDLFVDRLEIKTATETRQQRQKRVRDKRRKQLEDSFNSVGIGYHEQQGWFK